METLWWTLFESLPALAIPLFLVNFFLLVQWRRGGRVRPLLIGLVAAAALLMVQRLVVTQREHADRILDRIENDVRHGRTRALADVLAADFAADDMDRGQFLAFTADWLERVRVHTLHRTLLEVDSAGDGAFTATAAYLADVELAHYQGYVQSKWRVMFARDADGTWRIRRIEALEVNHRQVAHLRALRR